MTHTATTCLKNHFLIAMPHMLDPNFTQSVIYLIEHNQHGAMGLIINKPNDLTLADILDQLKPDETPTALSHQIPIFNGGPVQTDRGFVLHSAKAGYQSTLELGGLGMTTSQDILLALAEGSGPHKALIMLGYAGWDNGQLEAELADNAWLTCPAESSILFNTPPDQRLAAAANQLGVNLSLLSSQAGHA